MIRQESLFPDLPIEVIPYGLKLRQWRFVQEYLCGVAPSRAYLRAGFTPTTPDGGRHGAYRLLQSPRVASAIRSELAERAARVTVRQDDVIDELAAVAFSSISNYIITEDGTIEVAQGAPATALQAVASFRLKTTTSADGARISRDITVRLWDKNRALQMLGEHLGLLNGSLPPPVISAEHGEQEALLRIRAELAQIRARHAHAQEVAPQ